MQSAVMAAALAANQKKGVAQMDGAMISHHVGKIANANAR